MDFHEVFRTAIGGTLELPASEVLLLLAVFALCLLFRLSRTGLLIGYLCVYRWGWLFYYDRLFRENPRAFTAYIVFGILVLCLAVIGMLRSVQES